MNKTITFRADENDLKKIENLKDFYQECWPESDRCSTADIIRWSIGMLHMVKIENNFKWLSSEDLEYIRQQINSFKKEKSEN